MVVSGVVGANGELRALGGLVGTTVSGTFLILIGVLNLVILLDILRVYRRMQRGEFDSAALQHQLIAGGLMTRVFGRLFKVITASWQMYPVGFLFGLGFDTASEVALLAVAAGAAAQGLPLVAVVSLPLIFAAGMSLMDTTDGAFMAKAYSWAFSHPVRKVFYNLTVTGLSVFVALFVGGVEILQILSTVFRLHGGIFDLVRALDFSKMGLIIVGAFLVAWVGALCVYKLRRIDQRWGSLVEPAAELVRPDGS
jgi:high-affinity nickel-transport protein